MIGTKLLTVHLLIIISYIDCIKFDDKLAPYHSLARQQFANLISNVSAELRDTDDNEIPEYTVCHLLRIRVDPKKYGYGSIKKPDILEIGFCEYSCDLSVASAIMSKHAKTKAIALKKKPDLNITPPCCVPTKFDPINVTIEFEKKEKIIVLNDIMASECGCR